MIKHLAYYERKIFSPSLQNIIYFFFSFAYSGTQIKDII